jgi:hypothetical protein
VDIESDLKLDVPFRTYPLLTQVGGALIIAGLLLFTVVIPTHILVVFLLDLCKGKLAGIPFWKIPALLPIILGFLAIGSWMAHGVIRGAYEIARPRRILLAVVSGGVVLQVVADLLDYRLTLFLIEVIGIFAGIIPGFLLAKAGMEIAEIAKGRTAGGGLGGLAGLALGYFSFDSNLKMFGCSVACGLVVEGLGWLIRFAIHRRQKRT